MKKCLLILVLVFYCALVGTADTITLAADYWCPYNCTPETEQPGFLVEIAQKVYKSAGHSLKYRLMPWKRALAEGREGRVNGVIGFTKPIVRGFIMADKELITAREVFMVKKGYPWKYNGVSSLKELPRVGFPNGYHYTSDIDAYIKKGQNVYLIPGSDPLKSMVKMLLYNRIQTFPINEIVVKYYLSEQGLTGTLAVAGEFNRSQVFIGFGLASQTYKSYRVRFRLQTVSICDFSPAIIA